MKVVKRSEPLSDIDSIQIKIEVNHGMVVGFAVVQVSQISGSECQIVRYDSSHGFAHKDCLYETRLRKEGLPNRPFDELYRAAVEDIRKEWKNYKSQYIRNRLARQR